MKDLKTLIYEAINEFVNEYRYQDSATPLNSRSDVHRNLGVNPLTVDNGGHTPNDVLSQPSTFDRNGRTILYCRIINLLFIKLKISILIKFHLRWICLAKEQMEREVLEKRLIL